MTVPRDPRSQVIASGRWSVQKQISADRYYAAHLLVDLKNPRAVPILVPLLKDPEVNSIVGPLGRLTIDLRFNR